MPELTFELSVSRRFRNKDGYKKGNAYALNWSFETESHTAASFVEDVVKQGCPYTMVHLKRTPEETGAAARKVTTPKHTENFVSRQELTLDDDGKKAGDVLGRWLRDPFFTNFGLCFNESFSSQPGAERGHAVFLFDKPIADAALYQDCLKAACTQWPSVDWLINIDRTVYNASSQPSHWLGNVCPFDIFERVILQPWREKEAVKRRELEAKIAASHTRQAVNVVPAGDRFYRSFLAGYVRWIVGKLANKGSGDNRNSAIYWAGRTVAGIDAAAWASQYLDIISGIESEIVAAAGRNGYLQDYAGGSEEEVLRIFRRGRAVGGEVLPAPVPEPKKLVTVNGRLIDPYQRSEL